MLIPHYITFESVDENLTIQVKVTEQYLPVVLFIKLCNVILILSL